MNVAVAEYGGETTVYRIFRKNTWTETPLEAADGWTRQVNKHCTNPIGETKATAVWTDVDGGSVFVGVTGPEIIGREDAGQPV